MRSKAKRLSGACRTKKYYNHIILNSQHRYAQAMQAIPYASIRPFCITCAAVPNQPHATAQSKANKLKHLAKPNSFYFIRFALDNW